MIAVLGLPSNASGISSSKHSRCVAGRSNVGGGMSRGGQQVGESAADPPTFRRHMLAQHE
jgi:hypothetical protein